jgi:hypothetical protein
VSLLDLIREACTMAWNLRSEGDLEFADLFDVDDREELARLWMVADEWRLTAGVVAKLIADEFVRGKAVEVDGFLVVPSEYRTDEQCVDADGFFDWLADNPDQTPKLFNPTYARKGQLPPAVRDTFFEKSKKRRPEIVPQAIPVELLEKT